MAKQSEKLEVKLQYRHYVTQKVAKHFGIPTGKLKESTEMDQDVLYYPDLDEHGFRGLIYTGHYDKMEAKYLFNIRHLKRDGHLIESLEKAEEQVPVSRIKDVMVGVHWPGLTYNIWLFYKQPQKVYEGIGGCLIRDCKRSFVFEPIENYLNFKYPRQDEG